MDYINEQSIKRSTWHVLAVLIVTESVVEREGRAVKSWLGAFPAGQGKTAVGWRSRGGGYRFSWMVFSILANIGPKPYLFLGVALSTQNSTLLQEFLKENSLGLSAGPR